MIISNDEGDDDIQNSGGGNQQQVENTSFQIMGLDGPQPNKPEFIEDEEDRHTTNLLAELLRSLRVHQQFNHIQFPKLQEMARQRVIPAQLATCSACMYAKATKKSGETNHPITRMRQLNQLNLVE